jgi:DNA invertase Pin-like site-specific DNA recombinase
MMPDMSNKVKKMVAVYVRVSTADQNMAGQEAELQAWVDGNGIDPAAVRYFRDVESRSKASRPALDELRAAIFRGEVSTVVCWKIDRLAGTLKDGVALICDWAERNIRLVVTTLQIDISGPVGRVMAALLAGLSEIEMVFRRERQQAGIKQAKRRGVYKGRRAGTTKAEPARARELRAKGLTIDEIATSLACTSRTVHRYLAA